MKNMIINDFKKFKQIAKEIDMPFKWIITSSSRAVIDMKHLKLSYDIQDDKERIELLKNDFAEVEVEDVED